MVKINSLKKILLLSLLLAFLVGVSITTADETTGEIGAGDKKGEGQIIFYPSVETKEADSITSNSAKLNGELLKLGSFSSVEVSFEWGETEEYGNETSTGTATSTGKFSITLSGLTPNTLYHFRAKVKAGGNISYGSDKIFTTETTPSSTENGVPANASSTNASSNGSNSNSNSNNNSGGVPSGGGGDTIVPSISDINVQTARTSAIITWKTNESSISWIVYGTTTAYGKEIKTATYTSSHSITIEDLAPGTTYHYQVKSKDRADNIGQYTDKIFTTTVSGSLSTAAQKVDANKDDKIDVSDFNILMANWGKTGTNVADFNGDNKVDIFDFNALMINWSE